MSKFFNIIRYCISTILDKGSLAIFLFLAFFVTALTVIQPLLVGFVINLFIAGTTWSEILFYCVVVAALGILIAGCSYLAKTRYCQLQIDSSFTIERQLIDKIQHADSSFFSSYDSGHYRQTVNNDSNDVSIFILTQCVSFVTTMVSVLGTLAIILYLNPLTALVTVVLLLVSFIIYKQIQDAAYKRYKESKELKSQYGSIELSQFTDVDFIRRHSLFERFFNQHYAVNQKVRSAIHEQYKLEFGVQELNNAVIAVFQAIVFITCAYQIFLGALQPGYIATISSYFVSLLGSITLLMEFGMAYQSITVSLDRIEQILDLPQESVGNIVPSDDVNQITCTNVSFSYPHTNKVLMNNLSCSFAKGNIYAITGGNGTGKSTFLKLINGEWSSHLSGTIAINEDLLTQINQYELRKNTLGFTEQEPSIVDDTVRNNLTLLCKKQPTDEEIISYIKLFNLEKLLLGDDQNLDVRLGERSSAISGGEKQKIAIIRMMLMNPSVMLLDEPTSALDQKSVDVLLNLLKKVKQDHIILLISHDPKVVEAADHIVEL